MKWLLGLGGVALGVLGFAAGRSSGYDLCARNAATIAPRGSTMAQREEIYRRILAARATKFDGARRR